MKIALPIFFINLILIISSCKSNEIDYNTLLEIVDQFSDLESTIDAEDDKFLVLNFWATTCPPCIKEMPHFNKLESAYSNKNIKVLLVSLDRASILESRVYPFVQKHGIKPEVVLLKDQNYSKWTEKIDESWFGALPATLMTKGDKRKFRFGIYESYEELKSDVDELLNG